MELVKSLQLIVYENLRDKILKGDIVEDEIYSETKLAKELGVSRTPVRDAVHRLSQEGYIDIQPSKGFKLHKLSVRDIEEIFQVRSAIESYCTLLIAGDNESKNAKVLFKELERIQSLKMNIIKSSRNINRFTKYDRQFHMSIVDYSGNSVFKSIFDNYNYRMEKLAIMAFSHEKRMEETYKEHQTILDAMKNGDVDNINRITLDHMNMVRFVNIQDFVQDAED